MASQVKYQDYSGNVVGGMIIAGGVGGFSGALVGPSSIMATKKAFNQIHGTGFPKMFTVPAYTRNLFDFKRRALVPLFDGNFTNMLRFGTNLGATFVTREMLKTFRLNKNTNGFWVNTVVHVGCGAIAGAVGQAAAHPFDVARLRLFLDGKAVVNGVFTPTKHLRYNGGLINAIRMDGIHTLSRGFGYSILGAAIYRGIQLGFYDAVMEETKLFNNLFVSHLAVALVATCAAQVMTSTLDTNRKQMIMRADGPMKLGFRGRTWTPLSLLGLLRTSVIGAIPLAAVSNLLYHYHYGVPYHFPLFFKLIGLGWYTATDQDHRFDIKNPNSPCYMGK